jgi:glycosyltransferase involved in cell wall biosynthesis
MGLGRRVQLLGYRTDTADILAASDFFVLASAHEGLPVAMMEAMAMGLPVVATWVGGIPSMVASGAEGLLVPPSDPEALARAMGEVASAPDGRSAMAAAARTGSQRYDIRRAVARQTEVYEALAAERRLRSSR